MVLSTQPSNVNLPSWVCGLLGVVFIIAGLVVLGDVLAATIVSAVFIGICVIVAGVFEIAHAIWTKGWGGFFWHILLGILYIVAGASLVSQPAAASLVLTFALGIILVASGAARLFVGFKVWGSAGWLMVLSGVFGILAGAIILSGWPATGLWVIGFLLGIDLISHGLGWLLIAWRSMAA